MNRLKIGFALNSIKNFVSFFHIGIITLFLLSFSFSGCGYKTPPVWTDKTTKVK